MARGDSGLFGGGDANDRNRDGIDDEFDRQPGNPGTSPEYALKYDRRSEQEFSNRLETQNQIEEARLQARMEEQSEEAREALRSAQSGVHFFPTVGKFIVPPENTWAAHAELVKDERTNLGFNPSKYIFFDKIVAERLGKPALYDPAHPDYDKYEGLRTNIAVLRNDTIAMYLKDGSFDPGDEVYVPKIAGVAAAIGEAMANDRWYKRPFLPSMSVDVANVEGVGAREIYKYLLTVQTPPGQENRLRQSIEHLLHLPYHHWDLPPLEETPFSPAGLSAPAPLHSTAPIASNTPLSSSMDVEQGTQRAERAISIARRLRTPESLDVPTQEQSIDEARTILRWLKNLQFGERPMAEWIDQGTPAEQQAKSEAVARLIELYGGQLKMAAAKSPSIAHTLVMDSASQAAGAMALAIGQHALDSLPEGHARILALEDVLNNDIPASWEQRQNHSVNHLLEMVETGIEWASGKNVSDKTAIERLVDMGNRLQRNARQLQSVDTMQPPARLESVELAREILRKLKGISTATASIESLMKPGNVEDKAVLAQQLAEMADIYRNLLAEAAESNPNLLKDKRIADANAAVGQLTHTVKLMAAKEIPVSMAAAQQISADITQMPEEWKDMHDRTVNRLVKTMEGGLEKAVQDMQLQQEQAQQQDEELARHSVENSLLGEAAGKRKRRRRRGGGGKAPSLTKMAKRRNAQDLNGDGVADRFQRLGLNEKDLIAVRELGGNLRSLNQQAQTLPPPAEVTLTDAIAPDDRSFVAKKNDRDERDRNNRRNPRNQQPQI